MTKNQIKMFIVVAVIASSAAAERVENAGLYAIWVNNKEKEKFYSLPFITGGQTVVQWRDVEPAKDEYDFSDIDQDMEWFAQRGLKATVQVNGNLKPQWLFDMVPYHPEKLSHQVHDEKGTLMFWHPVHRDTYLNMIEALAQHLGNADYRNSILGIRLNFNPFGTEHYAPKGNPDMSIDKWIVPPGVDPATVTEYDKERVNKYLSSVLDAYVAAFKGKIRVFVRNGVKGDLIKPYRPLFENGTLSWFHTSSEVEPRASFAEAKYKRFYDDCRSGMTTAYAEPWASAWGHHGGKTDDRWCSPPQWMYWRLLFDLHCGVSFIAIYSSDTQVAIDGTYHSTGVNYSDGEDGTYQREFIEALKFAARYAGYHASPEDSPGAWIAFRENHIVKAANGIPLLRRRLKFFNTDYTFLMDRLPGDLSVGEGITNIGPDSQRFGAWARILPAGETLRLMLNSRFAASLKTGAKIRVVFYDDKPGKFHIENGSRQHNVAMTGSGYWQTAEFPMDGRNPRITLVADQSPLFLHMVEVIRNK